MSNDFQTVIQVCDQVERNRRVQPATIEDLARRAHTAFQDQGLDVSVAECQEAAEQVTRSSEANPPVTPTIRIKLEKPQPPAPVFEDDLPSVTNMKHAFVPVVAAGALWGFFHILAAPAFFAPADTAILDTALNGIGSSVHAIAEWADKLTCLGLALTLGRAVFVLFKDD